MPWGICKEFKLLKIKYCLNISGIYFNLILVGGEFPAVLHDLLEIGWKFTELLRWRGKAAALMTFSITGEFLWGCGCGGPVPWLCKHAKLVKSVQRTSFKWSFIYSLGYYHHIPHSFFQKTLFFFKLKSAILEALLPCTLCCNTVSFFNVSW